MKKQARWGADSGKNYKNWRAVAGCSLLMMICIPVIFTACTTAKVVKQSAVPAEKGYDTTLYNASYSEGLRQKMLGNVGEAMQYFEKAIKINSRSDAAAYEISQIALSGGDLENAYRYGRLALSIDGYNEWYLNNMANIFISANRPDSLISVLEKYVERIPGSDDVLYNLGGLYLEYGRAAEAEEIFNRLRETYGDNQQIIYSILNARNSLGKSAEAEQLLKEMIKKEPANINYAGMLAEQYRRIGEMDKADEFYRSLFEINPGSKLLQLSYVDFLLEDKRFEVLKRNLPFI